ncbi:hypothetical protein CHU_2919 [Cytophaga hutchinsonii ATCC 33406]|jgi:hypothetical protein|uniref:Uncharacterized protein n=1 Tax=Cytophaga hutchinsonii (strain ATCC 33406 / DSM 1761 / CIP 103989 / NBRC 15051 / NCIMB 9469 / D465) TaxID=269798 RepID=A0A6N4SUS7_CYTH3|nr:hypothetical protein CHU_2919 [Cytophaga hutchinsonii ATCC 33406]
MKICLHFASFKSLLKRSRVLFKRHKAILQVLSLDTCKIENDVIYTFKKPRNPLAA